MPAAARIAGYKGVMLKNLGWSLLGLIAALLLGMPAQAQTQALKSFAYASTGCSGGLMYFGSNWAMGAQWAQPGSGTFPSGDFWIRAVSLTYFGSGNDWAIVGHSGPNGDWVTPPALPGHTIKIVYPPDASPLFTAGEYFDVHSSCSSGADALVAIWYVPAP
jgi:hypothetical protein